MKTTLLLILPSLLASPLSATVDGILLGEMVVNIQNGNSSVAGYQLDGEGPYALVCSAEETGDTLLSGLSLKTPSGTTFSGFWDEDDGWTCGTSYSSLAALNAAVKTGTYTASLKLKSGGTKTEKFSLTSGMGFPATPMLNNYAAVRECAAGSVSTLSWQPFTSDPASSFGLVTATLVNNVGNICGTITNEKVAPGSTSSSTSMSLPYESRVGQKYWLNLMFTNVYSAKESSTFSGAAKAITSTTVTVVPFVVCNVMSGSNLEFRTYRTEYWKLLALDGAQTADTVTPSSLRVDLVIYTHADFMTTTNKVGLHIGSIDAAAVRPTSMYLRDSTLYYIPTCLFSNFSPVSGSNPAYLLYDEDESCLVERFNSVDLSEPTRTFRLIPTLNLENGILKSVDVHKKGDNGQTYDLSYYSMSLVFHFNNGRSDATISGSYYTGSNGYYLHFTSESLGTVDISTVGSIEIRGTSNNYTESLYTETLLIDANANPFSALPRQGGWIYPDGASADSFLGWFNDSFYPYVYSASADMLTNGTYKGDGKGWLYFRHASGDSGFYIYRYSTGSWAYTRADWHGWIYDYTSGWLDLTPEN